jgi:E3 ubiquitin-protein ligase makorin
VRFFDNHLPDVGAPGVGYSSSIPYLPDRLRSVSAVLLFNRAEMNSNRTSQQNILCKYYLHGACRNGGDCPFSHDLAAPASQVCTHYLRGSCSFGDHCRYDHVRPDWAPPRDSSHVSYQPPPLPKPSADFELPVDPFGSGNEDSPAPQVEEKEQRSVCQNYFSTGYCPSGNSCPHRHDFMLCKVCENYALNPTDDDDARAHVEECTARHNRIEMRARSQHIECGICYERIIENNRKFGLLSCEHAFCLSCIRSWRSNTGGGADVDTALRTCPVCRQVTYYIVPSAVWPETVEQKEVIISGYKAKLASIDCRFFSFGEGTCPFATSCFYKHAYKDGTLEDAKPRRVAVDEDEVRIVQPVKLCDFLGESLDKYDRLSQARRR